MEAIAGAMPRFPRGAGPPAQPDSAGVERGASVLFVARGAVRGGRFEGAAVTARGLSAVCDLVGLGLIAKRG